jgi:succinyl-CoA synthetase beta subunit
MLDADPAVKVILVSVFGGGTHMDRVASAMRDIMPQRTSRKPVVFRLDGTHVDRVDAILADIGATNHPSLDSAVTEAVAFARQAA